MFSLLRSTAIPAAGTYTTVPVAIMPGIDLLEIEAVFTYGSGGVSVTAYVQTSLDGGLSWQDIASFAFALASATRDSVVFAGSALPAATVPTDGTLAPNTVVSGLLGDQVRLKYVVTGSYVGSTLAVYVDSKVGGIGGLGAPVTAGDGLTNPTAPAEIAYIEGWDATNSVWRRIQVGINGALIAAASLNGQSNTPWCALGNIEAALNGVGFTYGVGGIVSLGYDGTTQLKTPRTPGTFKTLAATASGSTALWTPTTGKKFRLQRYKIVVTSNASLAAGAVLTIDLLDAAGALGQTHSVWVPTVAVTTGAPPLYDSGWVDLGNGQFSALANNVLNVNLSAALVTGVCRVIACGTEE